MNTIMNATLYAMQPLTNKWHRDGRFLKFMTKHNRRICLQCLERRFINGQSFLRIIH